MLDPADSFRGGRGAPGGILIRLRHRAPRGEGGFSLIEVLVTTLIIGILAGIAIPLFFSQRDKAYDVRAKQMVRTAQGAIEIYAAENDGEYQGANPARLRDIDSSLTGAALSVAAGPTTYTLAVRDADTQNRFTIRRTAAGSIRFTCTVAGRSGCPPDGTWAD